ncbi:Tuftelin-interacting protein 11, partial [Kappamyces sp. JEL0680]
NDWDPRDPDKVIELLDFYRQSILPEWLFSNIAIQLILPKLERSVDAWNFKKDGYSLHVWLFPWLPLLGDTLMPLWQVVRRRLQLHLREWNPAQEHARLLVDVWSEVWDPDDTLALLTNAILPQLISYLRHAFMINPSNQDLAPLLAVLQWKDHIPGHLMSNLLHTEFFPGWLQCLWAWIQSSQANLDEISQWYTHWKHFFAEQGLQGLEAVKEGFRTGLDMMNQGISQSSLAGGAFIPRSSVSTQPSKPRKTADPGDMKFRDLVEEVAAENSIEFVPLQKRHSSGKELYRLGRSMPVYIDNGVLFCYVKDSAEYQF